MRWIDISLSLVSDCVFLLVSSLYDQLKARFALHIGIKVMRGWQFKISAMGRAVIEAYITCALRIQAALSFQECF